MLASILRRRTGDVGSELAHRRDADAHANHALAKSPADLAVVECDGGRIRTCKRGQGPGVHISDKGWRETKVVCLQRAKLQTCEEDLRPDPPDCFCDSQYLTKIAETEALSMHLSLCVGVCGRSGHVRGRLCRRPGPADNSSAYLVCGPHGGAVRLGVFGNLRISNEAGSRTPPVHASHSHDIPWRRAAVELVDLEKVIQRLREDPGFHTCAELPVPLGKGGK